MKDPLQKLIVSGGELDKELLATVLADLVRLEKGSGEIRFTAMAAKLPKRTQIVLLLLGRKAAKALGLTDEEAIAPSEMEGTLGMKGGPLRGQLFQLKGARLVQSVGGKYLVPNYAIEPAKELIQAKVGGK
ncbi:MAG: hypothetical protein HYY31_03045 [Chloroflexi bacterium]|nr:hypothetical protein [Chloroflexota bacterium]